MTDDEHSIIRAVMAEGTRDRFSPQFTDRLLERIATDDATAAPLYALLWPQFRRLAIGAAAAALVMSVYTMNGATDPRPSGAAAASASIEEIYGLDSLQP